MAAADIQLLVNTVFYIAIFVSGFVISIPVGVVNINNGGNCFLYAKYDKEECVQYSGSLNCNFPIYFSVFACIFYGLAQTCYNAYAVYKSTKDPTVGSQMWVMPFILLNSLVAAVMTVVACMISVGFDNTCQSFEDITKKDSCALAENKHVRSACNGPEEEKDYDSGNFYKLFHVAEVAAWMCWLIWIALVISGIIRAVRNRRLRTGKADKANFAEADPTA
ncbi:uncharacterized protein LOC128178839 [Crassostrea angulata]|uniref:Transmembrane protein n=1 Tax=Magallana gigas TaxID=29159 RepID=K1QAZ0_MAGGI|nr:uncharacterized protein LOC105339548 [Crassostrea gigas]XP_052702170.1 uncharacterized protein LOC128178839 [Crassostrea angulata]|eukprot:XP_011443429.1 PREDICTED: uncharacterized protein LOC105339548 [Crassostrea gigas]